MTTGLEMLPERDRAGFSAHVQLLSSHCSIDSFAGGTRMYGKSRISGVVY